MKSRESVLTLSFWLKLCCTLGLYIFWWASKSIEVTHLDVHYRAGLFGSTQRTIPLNRVQDVTVTQGLLGKMTNSGTIYVESAGSIGTEIAAHGFANPNGIRDAILNRTA